uniref:Hsp90 co-chaperone Cdc37-like n=1 Tax=Oncorhynchus kisutch TaxID=8019 RepID=A0A8C7JVA7_ONCKI
MLWASALQFSLEFVTPTMNTTAVDNRRLRERERGGRGGVVGAFSSLEYFHFCKAEPAHFFFSSSNRIAEYFTEGRSLLVRWKMEILIGLLISSLSLYCDFTDAECLVVSPASLVVKYGDPASSNCSSDTPVEMGWEATQGGVGLTDNKVKILNWKADGVTDWDNNPTCFTDGGLCQKQLNITVYKLPDSVSISYRKYPDPMVEGHQYLLQCLVQNIAPIGRLRVTFYKVSATGEQTELDTQQKSKDNIKTPENGTYTLDFTPGRDDDGAQLLCSAMLDLGPEGPQPPPVMDSNRLNTNVHYKPQITSPGCFSMSITEGDTLSLNCSANGNPAPSYGWLLPQADPNTMEERSVVTITNMAKSHSGNYTCIAINPLGKSTCTVNVEVTVDYLPIIAGLAAAVVVILLVVSCFTYSSYYKHRRMGHYQLKDMLPRRHKNKHVVQHNGMDQSFM